MLLVQAILVGVILIVAVRDIIWIPMACANHAVVLVQLKDVPIPLIIYSVNNHIQEKVWSNLFQRIITCLVTNVF